MKIKNISVFVYLFLITNVFCACRDINEILDNNEYKTLLIFERVVNENLQCHKELGESLCRICGDGLYNHFVLLKHLSSFDDFKNYKDYKNGNTSMHLAVKNNRIIILKQILIDNSFAHIKNNQGQTAYNIAEFLENKVMIKLFDYYQGRNIEAETLRILNDLNKNQIDAINLYRKIKLNPKRIIDPKQIFRNFQQDIEREKEKFITSKQYKNFSLLKLFIARYSEDNSNVGLILRKLSGDKSQSFIKHVSLITDLTNFASFRNAESSKGFRAIDWAHKYKKHDVVRLLKLKGCKHSKAYKQIIKNLINNLHEKNNQNRKILIAKNGGNILEEKVKNYFIFARVVRKCLFLNECAKKSLTTKMLILSVNHRKVENLELLNEAGLLDFLKNKQNTHNFIRLLSMAKQNNDLKMQRHLLKIFGAQM